MMSWNSLIFCWNSSRVGKAISDNSLIGVPSCFSGGRRMVKCTRSTLASDLSRLPRVRDRHGDVDGGAHAHVAALDEFAVAPHRHLRRTSQRALILDPECDRLR